MKNNVDILLKRNIFLNVRLRKKKRSKKFKCRWVTVLDCSYGTIQKKKKKSRIGG